MCKQLTQAEILSECFGHGFDWTSAPLKCAKNGMSSLSVAYSALLVDPGLEPKSEDALYRFEDVKKACCQRADHESNPKESWSSITMIKLTLLYV